MADYDVLQVEAKWRRRWDESRVYRASNPGDSDFDPKQPHFYVLDMFPYPSGSGLHVGHASGYIGTDIITRKKRMDGFNVLHPMGWDAFGLPAEQYAILNNQHPRKTTDINTANFRRQLKLLALSYDWDREIDTSQPEYYRWTQWLFLKLFEKNLVYQKIVPVWWCEELKTVLANEEVINGRSERGNFPCERRPLKQWVLKITAYADRLLKDLDLLEWPENVKKMQADWIGRSEGAEIDFVLESDPAKKLRVFTTRPDTLFGVTALVLAPEHELAKSILHPKEQAQCEKYIAETAAKSERDRKAEAKVMSGVFTGSFVKHPLISEGPGAKIPIYLADYVIADYGTGALMSVPAHDERDFLFAKTLGLPILQVIKPADGSALDSSAQCFTEHGDVINSGAYSGLKSELAARKITEDLAKKKLGEAKTSYKIRDWVFSRQRYWGEPFPMAFDDKGQVIPTDPNDLPILLPEMDDFKPASDGSAPLARAKDWLYFIKDGKKLQRVTDTMPGWAGSCWYYLRFMDPKNTREPFSKMAADYWGPVDLYVGGVSHAVMHLLYARFWHKVFFDCGLVSHPEPFKKLFNQGMVTAYAYRDKTGRLVAVDEVERQHDKFVRKSNGEPLEQMVTKMAKSLKNVVTPDEVINSAGCDVLRLYEMFMGPLEMEKPWTNEGMSGCERFIRRTWNLLVKDDGQIREQFAGSENKEAPGWLHIERALHRAIKRVSDSFENFNFNTSVAAFMEFLNTATEFKEQMGRSQVERFLKILFPFAPHLSSEVWEKLGHTTWLDREAWPAFESKYLVDDSFELVISINGKVRKKLQVAKGMDELALEKLALENILDQTTGKTVRKVIVVRDKLVNVVVS